MAATRSGADDEAEPVAEMVIFSPRGYYQCEPHQGVLVSSSYTDEDGNEVVTEEIHNPDYTKRSSGCLADGAAMWLNTKNAQTPTNRVTKRADAQGAINELMSASEEYNYQRSLMAHGTITSWSKPRCQPWEVSKRVMPALIPTRLFM